MTDGKEGHTKYQSDDRQTEWKQFFNVVFSNLFRIVSSGIRITFYSHYMIIKYELCNIMYIIINIILIPKFAQYILSIYIFLF